MQYKPIISKDIVQEDTPPPKKALVTKTDPVLRTSHGGGALPSSQSRKKPLEDLHVFNIVRIPPKTVRVSLEDVALKQNQRIGQLI